MSTSNPNLPTFRGRDWDKFVTLLLQGCAALRLPSPGPLWPGGSSYDSRAFPNRWRNWARNQEATPKPRIKRKSEGDIVDVVASAASAGKHVRVLGGGYSFSPLVPTNEVMLDLTRMDDCSVDRANKTVTAGPGTTIAKLHHKLVQEGLCLETATVIPWITVGGAFGTGAHGTGKVLGALADLVVAARAVDGKANARDITSDEWRAFGCNLGALGVITSVTFRAEKLFNLAVKDDTRNYWFETTMLSHDGLSKLLQGAEYTSALWWPGTERCWVKKSNRTNDKPTTFEVQYFLDQLGIWLGAGVVTEIGKVLADHQEWTPIFTAMVFDAIRHQEYVSPAPDVFHFLTQYPMVWNMSFAFDVEDYKPAGLKRVVGAWTALVDRIEKYRDHKQFPLNMAVHMRHIRSSNSLLSPSTGHTGSVALEIVTLQGDEDGVWSDFFAEVEAAWLALEGRPHWGKVHGWGDAGGEPDNPNQLKRIVDSYASNVTAFRNVRADWDPKGVFRNAYTDALGL